MAGVILADCDQVGQREPVQLPFWGAVVFDSDHRMRIGFSIAGCDVRSAADLVHQLLLIPDVLDTRSRTTSGSDFDLTEPLGIGISASCSSIVIASCEPQGMFRRGAEELEMVEEHDRGRADPEIGRPSAGEIGVRMSADDQVPRPRYGASAR